MRLRVGGLLAAATLSVAGFSSVVAGASQRTATQYDNNATVVVAGASLNADLDPHKSGSNLPGIVDLYDGLIKATPDLKLTPSLATAWKYSADNLKLTLTIRLDVKFHDGSVMDAAAVVASLNRARTGSTSQQKAALSAVSDITSPNPTTVELTLSRLDAALVNILASPAGFIINPKMIKDDAAIRAGKDGIATGAYKVRSFVPSTRIVMDRNDDYWDKASLKNAPKTYDFSNVEGSARLNGLKTGAYMAVQSTGTPGLNGPGGLPDVDKNFVDTKAPSYSEFAVGFRLDKPPFDNEKVRLAIAHGIDFKTLTGGLLNDTMNCSVKPDPQISLPQQIGYDPKLTALPFDLKLAKKLMAEAGYPDGKGFPAVSIGSTVASGDQYAGQAFQQMLSRIGITNVSLVAQPSRVFVLADFQSGKTNMMTYSLSSTSFDPAASIDERIIPPPLVDNSTAGQQYKTLVTQAKTELDLTKRAGIYRQISKIANEHALYIPFCRLNNGFAHAKKLTGFEDTQWLKNGVVEARFLKVAKGK